MNLLDLVEDVQWVIWNMLNIKERWILQFTGKYYHLFYNKQPSKIYIPSIMFLECVACVRNKSNMLSWLLDTQRQTHLGVIQYKSFYFYITKLGLKEMAIIQVKHKKIEYYFPLNSRNMIIMALCYHGKIKEIEILMKYNFPFENAFIVAAYANKHFDLVMLFKQYCNSPSSITNFPSGKLCNDKKMLLDRLTLDVISCTEQEISKLKYIEVLKRYQGKE